MAMLMGLKQLAFTADRNLWSPAVSRTSTYASTKFYN